MQLLPIVPPNQSDSGSFDGVLELLVRGACCVVVGWSLMQNLLAWSLQQAGTQLQVCSMPLPGSPTSVPLPCLVPPLPPVLPAGAHGARHCTGGDAHDPGSLAERQADAAGGQGWGLGVCESWGSWWGGLKGRPVSHSQLWDQLLWFCARGRTAKRIQAQRAFVHA